MLLYKDRLKTFARGLLYTNGFQESIIYELSVLSFRLTEFCLVSPVALKLFLFGLISRSGNKHFLNYRGTEDTKRQPAEFCLVSPDYKYLSKINYTFR
jgi:hypothetical protein